jgi:DNA helicase II / ATP-dependent DNA helicase PcrA
MFLRISRKLLHYKGWNGNVKKGIKLDNYNSVLIWKYSKNSITTATGTTQRSTLSEKRKKQIAFIQNYKCKQCGIMLPPNYQIDHIVPVAIGGHNGSQNLQALCSSCHALKTQQDLINIRKESSEVKPTIPDWLKFNPEDDNNEISQKRANSEISDHLNKLNENQSRAALHSNSSVPARVVAGPGTGKTAVLTSRVAALITQFNVLPKHILTLTFTNRAAIEMRSRIVEILHSPRLAAQISMGTFHAICLNLLRTNIHKVGVQSSQVYDDNDKNHGSIDGKHEDMDNNDIVYPYRPGFGVYDEAETLKVIRDIVRKTLGWTNNDHDVQPSQYQKLISAAKNQGYSDARSYSNSKNANQNVAKVFSLYEKTLRKRNQIDFDDMLWLSVKLLSTNKRILLSCQSRWKYILVDEFQDTNGMQFEFLRLLGSSAASDGASDGANDNHEVQVPSSLFVVGDSDQAIYGFRGADYRNQSKYDDIFHPTIYHLSRNYRSVQPVLDCAHRLILPNYRKEENERNYINSNNNQHKNHSEKLLNGPLVGLQYVPSPSTSSSTANSKHVSPRVPVVVCRVEDDIEEGRWIVDEILRLKEAEKGAIQMDSSSPNIDIAILMRTNAQFRIIEMQLIREGVDHVVVNGIKFFDRREVRDTIAYIKCLHSPKYNDLALERIINVPPRLIGDKTILRLQTISNLLNVSLWEVLEKLERMEYTEDEIKEANEDELTDNEISAMNLLRKFPTRSKNQLLQFKIMMDKMRNTIPLFQQQELREHTVSRNISPISSAILSLLTTSGYGDWIRYENPQGEDRWNNIRELVNFASGTINLEDWLDEVALLSDPNELSNSDHERVGSKVKIMTIHAAKGSEFDVVFLAGMEEELLPHHYALMEDDVDEERRLCYVALTRAKRRVCVTFTKERVLWGQRRSVQPSQFLRDIDGSDVQWISHGQGI